MTCGIGGNKMVFGLWCVKCIAYALNLELTAFLRPHSFVMCAVRKFHLVSFASRLKLLYSSEVLENCSKQLQKLILFLFESCYIMAHIFYPWQTLRKAVFLDFLSHHNNFRGAVHNISSIVFSEIFSSCWCCLILFAN